jgi:NADPH-dependent F420 reductase
MATGLARGWALCGHKIVFGSREPGSTGHVAEEIGHGATATDHSAAVRQSEVVVLAVPYPAVLDMVASLREDLLGKVVMDVTNPLWTLVPEQSSGAQQVSQAIGPGARVVPAFKATFDRILSEPIDPASGLQRDIFICGDDEDAKAVVGGLVGDLGFRPVDCGPLSNAMILDLLVSLIIEVDGAYRKDRASSWKLLG